MLLNDILKRIERIEQATDGATVSDYARGDSLADVVDRNLEVIGEAVRLLPVHLKDAYPQVPWRAIIAMRNIIVHHYDSLDPLTIWNVVTVEIAVLKQTVLLMLSDLAGP